MIEAQQYLLYHIVMTFKEELYKNLGNLSPEETEVLHNIYRITETRGRLKIPSKMESWVKDTFFSLENVRTQNFLKITNRVTGEGSIFNELRLMRPVVKDVNFGGYKEEIERSVSDHFSDPINKTPEDTFGRIYGKYCVTASNVAKYDGCHGLIIFKEHNPLKFEKKHIQDYINVAKQWFIKAGLENTKAVYPIFIWNCLWKSGASITHGHAQLALTEGMAYSKVDFLRRQVLDYENNHLSNYFDDLYLTHKKINLGLEAFNTRIISQLTPIKNNEIIIIAKNFGTDLSESIYLVLRTLIDNIGVQSFNLIVYLQPLDKVEENWSHMPILVRIVDRGPLSSKTADIGGMELYAQTVVETNPYSVIKAVKDKIDKWK